MNLTFKTAAVAAGALLAVGLSSPANAAPGGHGNGVGGCVDQLYGNATNVRPGGHGVLPSQSPGPWVNNPADPDNPTWGPSLGALIQAYGGNAGQFHAGCPFV
jgi:hypothetical protein